MKGINAALVWLLTLAILAVPSFLFYNWWAKNKVQSARDTAVGSSVKDVFASAGQNADRAPAASRNVPSAPVAISSVSVIRAGGGAERKLSSPPVANTDKTNAEAGGGLSTAVTASAKPAGVSYFSPKRDRNPMLSPEDIRRMRQEIERRREAEQAELLEQSRRAKESGIEKKIQLQGIVGNAVIINGEMYTAGQSIYGGKIIKVGENYMIGEYKGRRFKKIMR